MATYVSMHVQYRIIIQKKKMPCIIMPLDHSHNICLCIWLERWIDLYMIWWAEPSGDHVTSSDKVNRATSHGYVSVSILFTEYCLSSLQLAPKRWCWTLAVQIRKVYYYRIYEQSEPHPGPQLLTTWSINVEYQCWAVVHCQPPHS